MRVMLIPLLIFPAIFYFSLRQPLFNVPHSPVLYDCNGVFLSAKVAADEQWRFPALSTRMAKKSINPKFAAALIECEDRRFYVHPGIDPFAVARAAISNLRAGRIVSGASTITMQTIRMSRQNSARNFANKLIEALLALRLEAGASKDEILSLYAENAPFGGNSVGLDAAALRYFLHDASELSWGEAAALAVLPNSPAIIHPGRSRDILLKKRDDLLLRLCKRGFFDLETLNLACAEPLPSVPNPVPQLAYHYLESYYAEKSARIGRAPNSNSTLDVRLQSRAASILNRRSELLQKQGIMNAACVILDTKTGEILAYVGNVETTLSPFVDMAKARRSSGSLLKPFLYAAMLDTGELMPKELVRDVPTRFDSYSPQNNTRAYAGAVPADEALTHSLNVPAVIELSRFGVARFVNLLEGFGISTLFRNPEDYGLPLVLGGAEVTLTEICRAYAKLGKIALSGEQSSPVSRGAAYITLETLTGVARPDEEASWRHFANSNSIAWKTGTSFGLRDGWAIGVTPNWTVGIWVGNASGEGRAGLSAASCAAPALFEIFSFLQAGQDSGSWFSPPWSELSFVEVCAASGFPAGPNCGATREDAIPKNAPRRLPCPFCRTIAFEKWFVLPPAEEWYYRRAHLDYKPPPKNLDPRGSLQGVSQSSLPLALFNPEPDSQIYVPVELDGSAGRVVFRAAHRDDNAVIYWHLDDLYLGSTTHYHELEARPEAGKHTLTIVDGEGNFVRREFTILDKT